MHDMYSNSYHKNNYAAEYDYMNRSGTDNQSEEDLDHHMHHDHHYDDAHHYDHHYDNHFDQHYDKNYDDHGDHNQNLDQLQHHEHTDNSAEPHSLQKESAVKNEGMWLSDSKESLNYVEFNKVQIEHIESVPTHGYLKIILM